MTRKNQNWRPFGKKNRGTGTNQSHVPFRLDVLFFIVFLLFTALIVRLSDLQIKQQDKFNKIVETGQKNIVEENAPRGNIYDSKGKILVGNKANQAIIFTRSAGMTADDIRKTSEEIVKLVTIEADTLTERDKKDFWLSDPEHLKEAQERLTVKDKANNKGEQASEASIYLKVVEKVTEDEINLSEEELKIASVFKKINGAYALQPVTIKNKGVTPEEIAVVGENTANIAGLSTGTDWEREYPEKDQIRTILGTVSSEKQGLPEDKVEEYLAKGYKLNDRVGLSYLEAAYEKELQGKKGQYEVVTDKNQQITSSKEVKPSEKGDNVMLTIDLDFQDKVVEILRDNYQGQINNGNADLSEGAYIVVTEPKTGDVLAMAGLQHDLKTGELTDDALGTINKAFVPGSSIKPATIMSGYENGIISGNQTMVDEPLSFNGGQVKSSLFNPYGAVSLTTAQALEVSSNVYMMKIALGMMGTQYSPGMILPIEPDVFNTLRTTYEKFGLGTSTGIDLPGESTGIINKKFEDDNGNLIPGLMGNLLDLSFGNYDTYTPMQLAQFVSTIANNGTRVAPHVVKGVYGNNDSGELGKLKRGIEPKILNKIEGRDSEFEIIQQGMSQVVYGPMGTGHALQGAKYDILAKTGTAETFAVDPKTNQVVPLINSTIVGYAPGADPQVAVSVVVPQLRNDSSGINTTLLREVINAYYDSVNATE